MRKSNKLIVGLLLGTLLVPTVAYGETFDNQIKEKKEEIKEVENQIKNVDKSVSEIEFQIEQLKEEKKYIEKRLVLIQERADKKKEELFLENERLAELRNDIHATEKELGAREELFKDRINSMYKENHTKNLIEVIFTSDGFGDMLNKIVSYKKIVDLDNQVIEEYLSLVESLENKEKATEEVIENINRVMNELTDLTAEVEKTLQEKIDVETELNNKKIELKGKLNRLSNDKDSLSEELKIIEQKKKDAEEAKKRAEEANNSNAKLSDAEIAKIKKQMGSESNKEINQLIDEKSKKYGIPANLLRGVIQKESGFNPNAINVNTNGTVDRGLMQINSGTAPGLAKRIGITYKVGIEFIPEVAVEMGAKYLSEYYRADDLHYTLTSYNRGPGGAKTWYNNHGTYATSYSNAVLNYMNAY